MRSVFMALPLLLLLSTHVDGQTLTVTAWTGEWVLDESRSDPSLIGVRAPRQSSRLEAATLTLSTQADGTLALERRGDNTTLRRVFIGVDGQLRSADTMQSKVTWAARGLVFETWEDMVFDGGTERVYEVQRWERDVSGALIVVTEIQTRMGTTTSRGVYLPKVSTKK